MMVITIVMLIAESVYRLRVIFVVCWNFFITCIADIPEDPEVVLDLDFLALISISSLCLCN